MFMDQTYHLLPTTPPTTYVILALMYCIEGATSRIIEWILSNLVVSRGNESALVHTLVIVATLLELRAEGCYDLCKNTTLS
jgi:hypothetical protein